MALALAALVPGAALVAADAADLAADLAAADADFAADSGGNTQPFKTPK